MSGLVRTAYVCVGVVELARISNPKHVLLITKDLFDDVQKQLHLQVRSTNKNKEFVFTKCLPAELVVQV
jgi:hypothetical protein